MKSETIKLVPYLFLQDHASAAFFVCVFVVVVILVVVVVPQGYIATRLPNSVFDSILFNAVKPMSQKAKAN